MAAPAQETQHRFTAEDVHLLWIPNERGEEVRYLAEANGFSFQGWDIDWNDISPYWLGAEIDGNLVAAVQMLMGKPVARMEMLFVDPELPKRQRAVCVRKMLKLAALSFLDSGAEAFSGLCPFSLPGYKKVMENMGGVEIEEGWIMLRRVR